MDCVFACGWFVLCVCLCICVLNVFVCRGRDSLCDVVVFWGVVVFLFVFVCCCVI